MRAAKPAVEEALKGFSAARAAAARDEKDAVVAAAAAKNEMDALVELFLREESVEKKQRDAVAEAAAKCAALDEEKDARNAEDFAAVKHFGHLKAARDVKIREIAKLTEARRDAEDLADARAAFVRDIRSQVAAVRGDIDAKSVLLEATKKERNAFVRASAAAEATAMELIARVRSARSELDVIKAESTMKERAFEREKHLHK